MFIANFLVALSVSEVFPPNIARTINGNLLNQPESISTETSRQGSTVFQNTYVKELY